MPPKDLRCYRKYLALCHVCTQDIISGALQTVECDVARNDIALESSVCNFYRKASCHDLLILHAHSLPSLDVQVLPQWKPMKVSL